MMWGFTLISGIVLLLAITLVKIEVKLQDIRILQLLGVKNRQLALMLGTEFAIIGLLAAVVWATAKIFTLSYQWNFAALLGIMITAMGLIILFGIGSIRLLGRK